MARFSERKVTEHKMCVLIWSTSSYEKQNSHSTKNPARYDTK